MMRFVLILSLSLSSAAGWADSSAPTEADVPAAASSNGKYQQLVQVLPCPSDQASYGSFNDYGYWGGGAWCGKVGRAGYWVWVAPNWYVWKTQAK